MSYPDFFSSGAARIFETRRTSAPDMYASKRGEEGVFCAKRGNGKHGGGNEGAEVGSSVVPLLSVVFWSLCRPSQTWMKELSSRKYEGVRWCEQKEERSPLGVKSETRGDLQLLTRRTRFSFYFRNEGLSRLTSRKQSSREPRERIRVKTEKRRSEGRCRLRKRMDQGVGLESRCKPCL